MSRTETDLLGDREVPDDAWYGIHTLRAIENFPISGITVNSVPELIRGMVLVKKAAALANRELGALPGWVARLYAMKMPRAFVITFAVAMRFFPTVKEEVSHVRDAMSLRGIGFSLRNLRLRPALVFEGFITPLLVRASTIAEELSAASITRGLDNPAPRTAFIKLGITFKDICLTFIFAAMLISVLLFRANVWRW